MSLTQSYCCKYCTAIQFKKSIEDNNKDNNHNINFDHNEFIKCFTFNLFFDGDEALLKPFRNFTILDYYSCNKFRILIQSDDDNHTEDETCCVLCNSRWITIHQSQLITWLSNINPKILEIVNEVTGTDHTIIRNINWQYISFLNITNQLLLIFL